MRLRYAVFVWFGLACCLSAQQQAIYVDPQIAGIFTRISQRTARVEPMLQQVRAEEWVAKGAPETYIAQLASARQQIQSIEIDMTVLAKRPDQLQTAMKSLFRVQAFHHSLESLMGGLRKYQNPALADLIQSVAAEDQTDLEALQNYLLELATGKEQEMQVMNREAQRCRAMISQQPLTPQLRKK